MIQHRHLHSKELFHLIRKGSITLAGHSGFKIYGALHCTSGKKIKIENRVFFKTETEAIDAGFRPCGHCLRERYQRWKVDS